MRHEVWRSGHGFGESRPRSARENSREIERIRGDSSCTTIFLHMYAYTSSGRMVALIDEKIAELTKAMVRYQ